MSQKERDRLHWLKQAETKQITQAQAAERMKGERALGKKTTATQEARGRPGGGPRAARRAVEPPAAGTAAEASDASGAARVQRFLVQR
jgi:hypothetical protein